MDLNVQKADPYIHRSPGKAHVTTLHSGRSTKNDIRGRHLVQPTAARGGKEAQLRLCWPTVTARKDTVNCTPYDKRSTTNNS